MYHIRLILRRVEFILVKITLVVLQKCAYLFSHSNSSSSSSSSSGSSSGGGEDGFVMILIVQ
jgi:uncharacterized membrane protein YgcG